MLAILLLAAAPAPAQGPAVLDLAALPSLGADCRSLYAQRFLLGNLPRAFAIGAGGQCGGRWGAASADAAREGALKNCADTGGTICTLYAEDLEMVWPGRPKPVRPAPPGPLLAGEGWAFVPDERFFWQGPEAARGVVVFAHGYSGTDRAVDNAAAQPPPFIRAFNNAGFDVVRFAREWRYDYRTDEMARHLREGLADMRRRGWKTLVLAGQSRGAWNSLQALDTPGLADTVIAISPAMNGTYSGAQILMGNPNLWIIASHAHAPSTRVAFVQFRDDPFYTDGDERVSIIRRLQDKVAALLVIDRPDGIAGHGGGGTAPFAERYGACLLRFATAAVAPPSC